MFWLTHSTTLLSPTRAFAITFSTPMPIMGQLTSWTTNLSTKTVTPPAMPPARAAKPRNRTTRAFQATPDPEYEKESAERRCFSTELMMSMPSDEKMSGSQSTKVTCTSEPLSADLDQTAASSRT